MEKILMTGAGYIGTHLAIDLINNQNKKIILIDNFENTTSQNIENIYKHLNEKENLIFHNFDIKNRKLLNEIFQNETIDGVVHTAATTSIPYSNKKPTETIQNNVNSLLSLLSVMEKNDVDKLVHSSSAAVYSKELTGDTRHAESDDIARQKSAYALSKQFCEDIIQSQFHNINTVMLRYFNPLGLHESGDFGYGENTDNIITSLFRSHFKSEQFKIYGDNYNTSDGTAVRDYISIDDIISANIKSLKYLENGNKGTQIYNIASSNGTSIRELIEIFESTMDTKLNIFESSRRKGDMGKSVGSNNKIKNELILDVKSNIRQSILSSVPYFQRLYNKQ